ncbi:hypothetical protein D081_2382 [Anaerovibrio sp. JC8]|nr:hypothetical protein D081_2382 [Anaerovibrio sp. JC8]
MGVVLNRCISIDTDFLSPCSAAPRYPQRDGQCQSSLSFWTYPTIIRGFVPP